MAGAQARRVGGWAGPVRNAHAGREVTGQDAYQARAHTYTVSAASRSHDLMQRNWSPKAPDMVWVSDFTYIARREGAVHVSFLLNVFHRRILSVTVGTDTGAQLVAGTQDRAISVRRRTNPRFTGQGVIVQSEADSPCAGPAFGQKLSDHSAAGRIGKVGTAYDNVLIESTFGLCQDGTDPPRRQGLDRQAGDRDRHHGLAGLAQRAPTAIETRIPQPNQARGSLRSVPGPAEAGRSRKQSLRNPGQFTTYDLPRQSAWVNVGHVFWRGCGRDRPAVS